MCDKEVRTLSCRNKSVKIKLHVQKKSQDIGYFSGTDVVIHTHIHSKYVMQNVMQLLDINFMVFVLSRFHTTL